MNADRETTGSGVDVVAAERPLPPPVEAAVAIERQGMRGNDRALAQDRQHRGVEL